MLDLILGALLVGLAIRGWMRGLVKEVISLAVLVVGTVAAFRLSTPVGRVLANMSGASPDATRYVAGIAIFLAVALAAAVLSRILHLGIRFLPGVSTLNRAAGAALSLIAITLVVTLAVSLATVMDLPDSIESQLEESTMAAALVEPDGLPQRVLGFLSGDRVVEISLRIRELTGSEEAVAKPGQPLRVPASQPDDLERLPGVEEVVFDLLNRERMAADVDPLLRSSGLDDEVAFDYATHGYLTGNIEVPSDGQLRERLNEEDMPSTQQSMVVVLAASPEAAHAALADDVGEILTRDAFTRVGVAVVQGPVGLLVVQVFSG
ncbi:MAG: CvpA family protein [bacterium]|nr:CvpA family protein [bacterium]